MARGRKRRNGKRFPSGRLVSRGNKPVIDRGTPEQQLKRAIVTTDQQLSPDYPLQILLGRGLITSVQHDAGMRLAQTYWALFGKPFGRSQDYQQPRGNGLDISSELRLRADYGGAEDALKSVNAYRVVIDLAVYLDWGWLIPDIVQGRKRYRRHQLRIDLIRKGLDRLASLLPSRVDDALIEKAQREIAA